MFSRMSEHHSPFHLFLCDSSFQFEKWIRKKLNEDSTNLKMGFYWSFVNYRKSGLFWTLFLVIFFNVKVFCVGCFRLWLLYVEFCGALSVNHTKQISVYPMFLQNLRHSILLKLMWLKKLREIDIELKIYKIPEAIR